MPWRCAILDDYQGVATTVADWSPLAGQVEVISFTTHFGSEPELAAAVADFEIIVTLRERVPFPASLLSSLPRLRLLVASGMRNSVIDFAAARQHGVAVCGTASFSAPPAELTWALLLGLARGLAAENAALRTGGRWQHSVGADLHGRTLGLLGAGKIGSQVAAVGLAFGMRVQAWSQNLTKERTAEIGVHLAATMEELLASSDFVSVHLALSDRTRNLLGIRELSLMKRDAYLVNTSRAAIVDQEALLAVLHAGGIAGAGVDVFDVEPLPERHPMRTAPRLLATPHLGYVTRSNYETYYRHAVEDIQAFLAGVLVRQLN